MGDNFCKLCGKASAGLRSHSCAGERASFPGRISGYLEWNILEKRGIVSRQLCGVVSVFEVI